jgi:hypothetical protein
MPCCIDVVDTACGDVSVWDVQCIWRDVVQQLQCWLRVSRCLNVSYTTSRVVCSWHVQCIWRDVMHEL